MAISETEWKQRVIQGLRNARRVYRTADTSGEKLERWLDRQIDRKTRPTCNQLAAMIPLWEDYRAKVLACEQAMADALGIGCI